jgi:hypothetical protein
MSGRLALLWTLAGVVGGAVGCGDTTRDRALAVPALAERQHGETTAVQTYQPELAQATAVEPEQPQMAQAAPPARLAAARAELPVRHHGKPSAVETARPELLRTR